jgi:hypothetical protein
LKGENLTSQVKNFKNCRPRFNKEKEGEEKK